MVYIKAMLVCLLSFPFLFSVPAANAAPPEDELNNYLTEIGWTIEELLDYMAYYEIPLEDFNTVDELREIIGTPLTSENLQGLLTKYNLSKDELEEQLDRFGDSLMYYKFIEDLDASVGFYVNHNEFLDEVESDLAAIGISKEELNIFFNYLIQVEEDNKNQLDQMTAIDNRLEKFLYVDELSQLTNKELDELVKIFEETISLYQIKVKFAVNQKDVTFEELLEMEEAPELVYASVYSAAGEQLLNFSVPSEFFETMMFINEAEDLIHMGELSDEYVDNMHESKYEMAQRRYK
jgi:processed acidic surface protein